MAGDTTQRARHLKRKGPLLLAIFLTALTYVVFVIGMWAVVQLFLTEDRAYGIIFLGALFAWALLLGLRFLAGRACHCPLCHGQWMAGRRCRMHEKARKYPLCKHRTSLMIDAALRWNFRCHYCGTPYRMRR